MKKELRIGNLIDYHGQYVIVLELCRDYAELGYFEDSVGFQRKYDEKDFPKPLLLTEEWLERFGFYAGDYVIYGEDVYTKGGEFGVLIVEDSDGKRLMPIEIPDKDNLQIHLTEDEWNFIGSHPLTFVHQLQNLYLDTEREELTLS